jgi:hypothetical protein
VSRGSGSSPIDENPVIHVISCMSIDTGLSNHRKLLWTQLNNNLTEMLISALLPKCGISNRFNMFVHFSLASHSCGSNVSTSNMD